MSRSNASGILFVAAGGLGDAVMLAHIFPRFAAMAGPGERICLMLRYDARKMAFLFEGRCEVAWVDYDRFAKSFFYRRTIRKQFGARAWRLIVSLDYLRHPKRDEALISMLPAAEKIAMRARPWAKYDRALARNAGMYARLFDPGPIHLDKLVRWSRFASWLNGRDEPVTRLLPLLDRLPPAAPTERPLAILVPYSAVREKQAAPDLFVAIARAIPHGHDILVAGAPDDPAKNPDYAALLAEPRVRFEACDFMRLAALMRAASIVVSVDTAAMHLAVAAGAPTLCLASAAYVGEIVPYADEIAPANVRFVHVAMDCAGCLGACIHPREGGMFPCVARLPRDEVLDRLSELLRDGRGP